VFAAALLCGCLSRVGAAQEPADAYRVGWGDVASVTAASALLLTPMILRLPEGPPACAPCDPATLSGFDRIAVRPVDGTIGMGSNLALLGVAGFAGWAVMREAPPEVRAGNAAVFLNAVSWTAASTQWLKVIIARERPVLYTTDAPNVADQRGVQQSFPSGHTSVAFAAATSYAVMAHRQRLPHRTRNTILLYAGATLVGGLRVSAGKHFPTDVIGGAALGAGVGWLVATVHPAR